MGEKPSTYYVDNMQEKENQELSHFTPNQLLLKKTLTDYVIRSETILTTLRNARQIVDGALIIKMILKGLPRHFEPFFIYVTHID